jgi:hypothetical protein
VLWQGYNPFSVAYMAHCVIGNDANNFTIGNEEATPKFVTPACNLVSFWLHIA